MKKQSYLLGSPTQIHILLLLLPIRRILPCGPLLSPTSAVQVFLANIKTMISWTTTLTFTLSGYESTANALQRLAEFRDFKSQSTE
jgi:hypothetical protein